MMYFKDNGFRSFHIGAMRCHPVQREINPSITDLGSFGKYMIH